MKRKIYALIFVLSPLFIWAQAPGTNGRAQGVRPKPVTESPNNQIEKIPDHSEFLREMGIPVDLDNPEAWLERNQDLQAAVTSSATLSAETTTKKLQQLEAKLVQLQLLNEQLRADNEDIRRSMYACCSSGSDEAGMEPSLYQNSPNPAQEETAIGFFLPDAVKEARLDIRDTAGKLHKRIPLTDRGNSKVTLDRAQLGNGTYVYTLFADQKLVDSKILLIQQ